MGIKNIWKSDMNFTFGEKITLTQENLWIKLARRLPRSLSYWNHIIVGAANMKDDEVVPEVGYTTILSRLDK